MQHITYRCQCGKEFTLQAYGASGDVSETLQDMFENVPHHDTPWGERCPFAERALLPHPQEDEYFPLPKFEQIEKQYKERCAKLKAQSAPLASEQVALA